MTVVFDTIDEFTSDLLAEHEDGNVEGDILRITRDVQSVNSGTTGIWLVAGFMVQDEVRELRLMCGCDYVGLKDAEQEGSKGFAGLNKKLEEMAKKHEITIRGGRFE